MCRILIEDRDIYNWESVVTESIDEFKTRINYLHSHWSKTAGEDVLSNEFSRFETRLWNTVKNVEKGLLGPDDHVRFTYDGMQINVSLLGDLGKHTGKPFQIGYLFGPITKQQHEDPWRMMENSMNMICQYGQPF